MFIGRVPHARAAPGGHSSCNAALSSEGRWWAAARISSSKEVPMVRLNTNSTRVAAAGLAGGPACAAGCSTNPATGKQQIALISEQQEISMGSEADQQVQQQLGLYPDQELQAYVNRVGQKLAAASERPNLPWTFRVVDDPVVNAFALPGGHIYVTRGPDDPPDLGGRAGLGHRPRDRPRHRPPQRGADEQGAARADRPDRGHDRQARAGQLRRPRRARACSSCSSSSAATTSARPTTSACATCTSRTTTRARCRRSSRRCAG